MSISKTFHLLLVGIAFFLFLIVILTDSYDYFIRDKYFEGYAIAAQVLVFDFVGIILSIFFLIKRDYKRLLRVGLFYISLSVIGLIGFKIPLILLPIISLAAVIYIFKMAVEYDLEMK